MATESVRLRKRQTVNVPQMQHGIPVPKVVQTAAPQAGFSSSVPAALPSPQAAAPVSGVPTYSGAQFQHGIPPTMESASPPDKLLDDPPGNQKLDAATDVIGEQGVVADLVSSAAAAQKVVTKFYIPKWLNVSMALVNGEGNAFAKTSGLLGKSIRGLGKLGQAATMISIPFAGYDVYKAVKEKDSMKKPLAWANATFTVSNTALGAVGLWHFRNKRFLKAKPLFLASAAIGAGQLIDAHFFQSRVQNGIGHAVKNLWGRLRK